MAFIQFFFLSVITSIFVVALVGDELLPQSAPDIGDRPSGNPLDVVFILFIKIWSGVLLLWDASTFNVPDAPWYARVTVGAVVGAPIVWGIINIIRGTSSD